MNFEKNEIDPDHQQNFLVAKGGDTSHWVKDELRTQCKECERSFNETFRKHHCRRCGEIFCDICSRASGVLTEDRMCGKCLVLDAKERPQCIPTAKDYESVKKGTSYLNPDAELDVEPAGASYLTANSVEEGDYKSHWSAHNVLIGILSLDVVSRVADSARKACCLCRKNFTFTNRRHHCRACGN
jgi:hypothetical protein